MSCSLQFTRKHVYTNRKRRRVIFTDEKRFSLDESDDHHCYDHDLREEQQFLTRRRMRGGDIMIWGGVGY